MILGGGLAVRICVESCSSASSKLGSASPVDACFSSDNDDGPSSKFGSELRGEEGAKVFLLGRLLFGSLLVLGMASDCRLISTFPPMAFRWRARRARNWPIISMGGGSCFFFALLDFLEAFLSFFPALIAIRRSFLPPPPPPSLLLGAGASAAGVALGGGGRPPSICGGGANPLPTGGRLGGGGIPACIGGGGMPDAAPGAPPPAATGGGGMLPPPAPEGRSDVPPAGGKSMSGSSGRSIFPC
mmetsp:Transcript_9460/g.13077  ORF Transcript_9460/g.13077 Transcript_9460/m.13077 type:complete len:243 (-) Transcript_9460:969-1697(-)